MRPIRLLWGPSTCRRTLKWHLITNPGEEFKHVSTPWLERACISLWTNPKFHGHGAAQSMALPAVARNSSMPNRDSCKIKLFSGMSIWPCHACTYLTALMLVRAGSCRLWYASCLNQEKFIFLAKHQWFCSYCCSSLDTRRLCTCSSKQNSTASLLLLCFCFHCTVFWLSLYLSRAAHLFAVQSSISLASAWGQIASTEFETPLNTCLMLSLSLLRGWIQGLTLPSSAPSLDVSPWRSYDAPLL